MKKSISIVAGVIAAALLFTSCDALSSIFGGGQSVKTATVDTVAKSELDAPKNLLPGAHAPSTDAEAKKLLSASDFDVADTSRAAIVTRTIETSRSTAVESVARATSGATASVSSTGYEGFDNLASAVATFSTELTDKKSAKLKFDGDVSAKIPAVGLELSNANVTIDLSAKYKETTTTTTVSADGTVSAKAKVVYNPDALTDTILGEENLISGLTGLYKVVANTAVNAKVKGFTCSVTTSDNSGEFNLDGSFGVSAAASVGTTIVTWDDSGKQLYGQVVVTANAKAKGDLEKIQAKAEKAYNAETNESEKTAAAMAAVDGEVSADVSIVIYDKDGKQTWSKKFATAEAAYEFLGE